MANRFTYPRETALDSNGDPLGGAKLYFYESSTTKAADTFSDEGLGVANANPVVADSAGRFGDIWLKAQDYKVVLADAADVTIWTVDPVHGTLDVSGDDFKTGPQSPADMTVLVAPGSLYDVVLKALVARAAQTSALITAPSSNPRKDIVHIDRLTGVIGIDTGTEAASPVDPAIGDGKLPVARIALATTTIEITDSEITDIRELGLLGAIGAEHIQNQTFSYATAVGGTGDVVTAVFAPVLAAFTEGMRLALKVGTTNTGAVTLNPDGLGAKSVKKGDGATALDAGDWTAGQLVEVEYDGTNFQMVSNVAAGAAVDVQTFTSSGTWNKPSGATRSLVMLWGGGGSGSRDTVSEGGAGGGGAFMSANFDMDDLGTTETVTIGAGGASISGSNGNGNLGGTSTFGALLTIYGGGGGGSADEGGGGGGVYSVGQQGGSTAGDGGDPLGGVGVSSTAGEDSTFGGGAGGGDSRKGGRSVYGGGGGGGRKTGGDGGDSMYGGAGGGGGHSSTPGVGGTSVMGGAGGAGAVGSGAGGAGTQPGGGGGSSNSGDSGAGGDGQCVVISW